MQQKPKFCTGHQEIVTELLNDAGQDINYRSNSGKTALTVAVENGEQLITALYISISGQVDIFKELVEKDGVNLQLTNSEGKTVEQLAR